MRDFLYYEVPFRRACILSCTTKANVTRLCRMIAFLRTQRADGCAVLRETLKVRYVQVPAIGPGFVQPVKRVRSESSSTAGPVRKVQRFTHPKDLEGWLVWHYDPDSTNGPAVDHSDQFVSDRKEVPMPVMPAADAMLTVMKMLEGKDGVYSYLYNANVEYVTDGDFLPFKKSKLIDEAIDGKYLRNDFKEYVTDSQDRSGGYVFLWRVCAYLDPTKSGKNSRRCYWYGLRNVATGREFTMSKGPKVGMVKELLQLHTIVGPKVV